MHTCLGLRDYSSGSVHFIYFEAGSVNHQDNAITQVLCWLPVTKPSCVLNGLLHVSGVWLFFWSIRRPRFTGFVVPAGNLSFLVAM